MDDTKTLMAEEKPLDMSTVAVSQSITFITSTKSTFSDIAKEIKPDDSGLVCSTSDENSFIKKSLAEDSKKVVNLKRPLVEDEKIESKKPVIFGNREFKKNNALFIEDHLFNTNMELIIGNVKFIAENQPLVKNNKINSKNQPLVESNYVKSKKQHLIENKEAKPKEQSLIKDIKVKPKICNEHGLSFKGKNKTSLDGNVGTYEEPETSSVVSPKDALNVPPSKIVKPKAHMNILPKSKQKVISNTITAVKQTSSPRRVLRSSSKSGSSNSSGALSCNTSPTMYEKQLVLSTLSPSMTTDERTTNTSPTTHLKLTKSKSATIFKNSKLSVSMVSSSVPETSESILTADFSGLKLHSKRRKIKANRTENKTKNVSFANRGSDVNSRFLNLTSVPVQNNYKMFLDIRKEISKKHKNLFAVQPKPPPGFENYLMNKRTYHLAGNSNNLFICKLLTPPVDLHEQLKSLFNEQEKERHKLCVQHKVQREKLMLCVEQEIIRVHGNAARKLANQPLPFSACTFLKDKEVYSMPKKEDEDTNTRSHYDGRLFISWAQEMDDKWDRIMDSMIARQHNEAESLHAVQKMDWGLKLKELKLCSYSSEPYIDKNHVPVVYVADDFDLITA